MPSAAVQSHCPPLGPSLTPREVTSIPLCYFDPHFGWSLPDPGWPCADDERTHNTKNESAPRWGPFLGLPLLSLPVYLPTDEDRHHLLQQKWPSSAPQHWDTPKCPEQRKPFAPVIKPFCRILTPCSKNNPFPGLLTRCSLVVRLSVLWVYTQQWYCWILR